ncbi:ATP-dependent helicase [Mumia sp. zg.B53]|uniref:ATP-dependent helicase n=1 Tax=Mumia sp. zg.B53 TaxID=2855449 RepID=UPI001C6E32FC|nr:ATP-dependent helicase [Mumia sp. zg.B53]MBW9216513.1 ATP-dependent helicase [Mumia sp. zg.B53]
MPDVLDRFSPATAAWFRGAFPAPTTAQTGAWDAIADGRNALVVAPTGSGKTLSAFLWALDRLITGPPPDDPKRRTRVLYVSPLKALAVDVERNLRAPLVGITQTATRMAAAGESPAPRDVTVGVRSGDTTPAERRALATRPPDVLITTPESLFLVLTSAARETLRDVEAVIVDEVHAVAGTKRGAHLALTLERLDALLEQPAQRIGLSATVRPHAEVARFLAGSAPVRVVAPESEKRWDLSVVVPVEDMTAPPVREAEEGEPDVRDQASIWPHVEERVVDLVEQARSSIVFANSRRLAERLTARLNEIHAERLGVELPDTGSPAAATPAQSGTAAGASPLLARAHHGSVSKEQRALIEDDLKSGRLPCVVATSSLELGIDMGAVDLVVQVESPPSVASGLQRVGRAGHQVGEVSRGVVFPKHRIDLLEATVTIERMVAGAIEELSVPTNPLDVLAQQVVATCALESWDVDDLYEAVRRAAPYATLPRSAYDATLDLLAGRYPSDEFAELRPRIVWDRVAGTITGRPGAQRLAVTSGGTIPDRGLFGVYLVGAQSTAQGSARVGELDEEMVYESRVGDVFALGATSWRIEDITHDRVLVSPAYGQPGRLPFWRGDNPGRPIELGRALGAFTRVMATGDRPQARARCEAAGLDAYAIDNLFALVDEQRAATGRVPDDTLLVVERFRDELGDWRLVLHSPLGLAVHAPWALAVGARVRDRYGLDSASMASDDGIVVRLPETDAEPPGGELFAFTPEEIEDLVTEEVGGSALFAARFRECAARALLLPRRDPGRRSPLWQQRQRAAQLLEVARRYPTFPIVLETVREVLQDVYDVPSLVQMMRDLESRRLRVVDVETQEPSPFAKSLLFGYVAAFLYEGDSPLAERRAAALSLDSSLLSELLGRAELRDLLDAGVLAQTEAELQRLVPDRRGRGAEGVADLLRLLGPLTSEEVAERSTEPSASAAWLVELAEARRILRVSFAGRQWWVAVEDAARLRDALGVPVPMGVPDAFLAPVDDPLGDLVARYARTHAPFVAGDVAERLGLGVAVVSETLRRLAGRGRVSEGEFTPGAGGSEWCDAEVLRRLRRRSLAALRKEVEPVSPETLGRFLPAWQHVGGRLRGIDGLVTVVEQLAGASVPASALEPLVLGSRVLDYSPAMLDELTAAGEVLWSGAGGLPGNDGWVSLHLADTAPLTLAPPVELELTSLQEAVLGVVQSGGAYFFRQLAEAVKAFATGSGEGLPTVLDSELADAVWDLVWAGYLTNDTLAPLRALVGVGRTSHRQARTTPRLRGRRAPSFVRPTMPSRTAPPTVGGRWALVPRTEDNPTVRAHAQAEQLLERHGLVTRGTAVAEGVPGGFAAVYKVLSGFEEAGRARRGYFVEGLGAAQFATPGSVDRLRSYSREPGQDPERRAVTLAATDPANPYGAALGWPETEGGHRPGRKAGALVVLVDGALSLYVERGGRTLLTFDDLGDPEGAARLQPAIDALATAVRDGALGRLMVERADGEAVLGTPLGDALAQAGFHATPRGLRIRG